MIIPLIYHVYLPPQVTSEEKSLFFPKKIVFLCKNFQENLVEEVSGKKKLKRKNLNYRQLQQKLRKSMFSMFVALQNFNFSEYFFAIKNSNLSKKLSICCSQFIPL